MLSCTEQGTRTEECNPNEDTYFAICLSHWLWCKLFEMQSVLATIITPYAPQCTLRNCLCILFTNNHLIEKLQIAIVLQVCKSKSKGNFKKKHIYCKYTEIKLILIFYVIPLDFNAPLFSFLNSVRRKVFWLSLINFAPRHWLFHRMKNLIPLRASFIGRNIWKSDC
jgi:hypothetical protein